MGRIPKPEPARLFLPGHDKPIDIHDWQLTFTSHRLGNLSDIEVTGTIDRRQVYPYSYPEDPVVPE